MSSIRPKRPFGLGTYLAIMGITLVAAVVMGVASAVLDTFVGVSSFWIHAALMLLTMALATALSIWWWRGIDEAAREAHKWAWWWGGTGGMVLGMVILLSLQLGDDKPIDTTNLSAGDLIAGGMITILVFQGIGYAIAWAAWWLRHR